LAVDTVAIAPQITVFVAVMVVRVVAAGDHKQAQTVAHLLGRKVSVGRTKQVVSVVAVVVLALLVLVVTVEQVLTLQDSSVVPHYSSAVAVAVEQ